MTQSLEGSTPSGHPNLFKQQKEGDGDAITITIAASALRWSGSCS